MMQCSIPNIAVYRIICVCADMLNTPSVKELSDWWGEGRQTILPLSPILWNILPQEVRPFGRLGSANLSGALGIIRAFKAFPHVCLMFNLIYLCGFVLLAPILLIYIYLHVFHAFSGKPSRVALSRRWTVLNLINNFLKNLYNSNKNNLRLFWRCAIFFKKPF